MSPRPLLITFAALLVAFLWPAGSARAEIDITGTWNFAFSGEPGGSPPFECHDVEISQADEDIVLASDECFPSGEATGNLNKATGAVSIGPSCVDGRCSFLMWGTVSSDGETISGTYGVIRHTVGTFQAVRKPATVGGYAMELQTMTPGPQAGASSGGGMGVAAAITVLAPTAALAFAGAAWYAIPIKRSAIGKKR